MERGQETSISSVSGRSLPSPLARRKFIKSSEMTTDKTTQFIEPVGFGPAPTRGPGETLVFVCHASEDRAVAKQLSDALLARGIATFIDVDDVRDASFVAKINFALHECTHFVALLSPISAAKKWPRHEMQTITLRVVDGTVTLLPIALSGYTHAHFRKDFATLAHIPIRRYGNPEALSVQLINDIFGVTRKPALGEVPEVAKKPTNHGLSKAACAVAEWFADNSLSGLEHDPIRNSAELAVLLGLTREDFEDARHQLMGYLKTHGFSTYPTNEFFVTFDPAFKGWNPRADALRIAAALQSDYDRSDCETLAKSFGFAPRRMNPAVMYLVAQKIIIKSMRGFRDGYQPFIFTPGPQEMAKLRRFLRDNAL